LFKKRIFFVSKEKKDSKRSLVTKKIRDQEFAKEGEKKLKKKRTKVEREKCLRNRSSLSVKSAAMTSIN